MRIDPHILQILWNKNCQERTYRVHETPTEIFFMGSKWAILANLDQLRDQPEQRMPDSLEQIN